MVCLRVDSYLKNDESLNFRFKKIDDTRNYLLEEVKHNKLISKRHKKTCVTLNYFERLLILASTFTGCVSVSASASLVGVPLEFTSSAVALKFSK